jgi:hypothetical protein
MAIMNSSVGRWHAPFHAGRSLAAFLAVTAVILIAAAPVSGQERLPWNPAAPAGPAAPPDDDDDDDPRYKSPAPQPYGRPAYGAPAPSYPAPPAYPAAPRYQPAPAAPHPTYSAPVPAPYGGAYPPPTHAGPPPGPAPSRPLYGDTYVPPRTYPAPGAYAPPPRSDYDDDARDGTFSMREILDAGHGFFGSISKGLASVVEHAFRSKGRPNGYILGEDLGGAFVAGLRYGEGRLYTKEAGALKVFWQGPSVGFDAGAEGSRVMVLVYNLREPADILRRFGGVDGSAYVVGGVGVTFLVSDDIIVAPIRSGIGLRLGANVGYLKYTPRPTWNPF